MIHLKQLFIALNTALLISSCGGDDGNDTSGGACGSGEYYSFTAEKCVKVVSTSYKDYKDPSGDVSNGQSDGQSSVKTLSHDPNSGATVVNTAPVTISVARPECRVKNLKFFDSGVGFSAVYISDCLEGDQLYLREVSYDGAVGKSEVLLSPECYDYFYDVSGLLAAASQELLMISYRCGSSSDKLITVNFSGEKRRELTSYSPGSSILIWHRDLELFGVYNGANFSTYSASGIAVTSRLDLSGIGSVKGILAMQDGWLVTTSSTTSCSYYCSSSYKPTVSKISSSGQLLQKQVVVSYLPDAMIETNRVIAVKDGSIKIASFNPSTLAFAPLQQASSGSGSNFFDHLRVNDNLHLSLTGDYSGLYLHQFTSALSGNVISSLQIARNVKENSGGMKIASKNIYVSYINATNQGIIALAGSLP